ncbi:hypothetical protein A2W14_01855 [Candidatus Gottesmanbacteria bacterium RBG_16_37_8]|uniref:Prephenate dehydratase n=1 Tax=Candidatus Gottesmanbacteria bacterium RBG_16_37_8 TaxID=1798371 RepID=A0A1F5YUT5_9BACT|nr:MAG: hypothetical protein A2W14_01855 [Candidatus Gottesmanbacteria bacterium RBG_16_37_8]
MRSTGIKYMAKTILFLGKLGSNSHLSADKIKKAGDILLGKNSLEEIFSLVSHNEKYSAVVPLENTLTGSINLTFDLFRTKKVQIISELILKINHCLIAKKNNPLKTFKFCLSHPEVFKQCSRFIKKNLKLSPLLVSDTATAAQNLLKFDENFCALANKYAAGINGLSIIKEHLEDDPSNYTRFVVIGKKSNLKGNKISIIFSLIHQPGSLVKALLPVAGNHLNLTKIESRPIIGRPWEYLFFVDLEIGKNQKGFINSFQEMKRKTKFIKILGQYDKGVIIND